MPNPAASPTARALAVQQARIADSRKESAMTQEHSPEPWSAYIRAGTYQIDIGDTPKGTRPCVIDWPGFDGNDLGDKTNAANARRIVAAVNACAGIPTAALEAGALAEAIEAAKWAAHRKPAFAYVGGGPNGIDPDVPGSPYDRGLKNGHDQLQATLRAALAKLEAPK